MNENNHSKFIFYFFIERKKNIFTDITSHFSASSHTVKYLNAINKQTENKIYLQILIIYHKGGYGRF